LFAANVSLLLTFFVVITLPAMAELCDPSFCHSFCLWAG